MTVIYVRPSQVHRARQTLRRHLRHGQRSLHFTKEKGVTREAVLKDVVRLPIAVVIYRTAEKPRDGRRLCLTAISQAVRASGCQRLVLDQDDSVVTTDRRVLRNVLGGAWEGEYVHLHD